MRCCTHRTRLFVSVIGQACNVCWQQKRRCSNGSKSCPLLLIQCLLTYLYYYIFQGVAAFASHRSGGTKVPKAADTRKCKAYSTTVQSHRTDGCVALTWSRAHPVGKRPRVATPALPVRFMCGGPGKC